jgi:hypothetical protein
VARITHVKQAQQRYETVTVLDEAGQPRRTAVMRQDGTQKVTKSGRPVFMTQTVADKSKPLPLRKCDACHKEIELGTAYKHISPKSGPYGGRMLTRHEDCPTWHSWEYSSSLGARLEQVSYNFHGAINGELDSAEDVTEALSEAAEAIREIASEKEEGADNIESGFGHETFQSSELREQADALNEWADEVEQTDVPDYPEPEEQDCDECGGGANLPCDECDSTGRVTPDEPTEEQLDEWRSEVEDALAIVDEAPV